MSSVEDFERDYPEIPMVDSLDELMEVIYQDDNGGFDPDRPFDGQRHTDEGERGKTECRLRFRDVADCIAIGFFHAAGFSEERIKASTKNDLYALALDELDPVAVMQNAICEMERRMGIYPNIDKPPAGRDQNG